MTRFNFIGAPDPPFAAQLRALAGLPDVRRAALAALACLILCAAAAVAEYRGLEHALARLDAAHVRARGVDSRMAVARAEQAELNRLFALSSAIRAIHASGAERAAVIAEIGDRIPAGVRIRQMEGDAGGTTISGEANTYPALAGALRSLESARTVSLPTLRQAQQTGSGTQARLIAYELHVRERTK
jgi:Tfp pilus assembly protein PilN